MQVTDKQMDAAVEEYRGLTNELFLQRMNDSPEFRAAIEAAYERGQRDPTKDFVHLDRDGWRPNQFNVDIPPARPNESDPFGPGAPADKIRKYQRHPGDPYPTY